MAEFHKHIIVTGYIDKVPDGSYIPFFEDWFARLVESVGMKVLIAPKCVWSDNPGNEGITGIVCIDTSHSSIHVWGDPYKFFKFDLYSCRDFSTDTVIEMLKELGPYEITYSVINRTDDEHPVIESGRIKF